MDNFSDLLETPHTSRRDSPRAQLSSDLQRPTSSLSVVSSSYSQVTSGAQETQERAPQSPHQTKESYDKYDTASISSLPSYNQVNSGMNSSFKIVN